jgi:ribonuclease HI
VKTLEEVLCSYSAGPQSGVFTDGGAQPNPGPGGWGFVHVVDGKIVNYQHGHAPDTTNNRMELTALIQAYSSLPSDTEIEMFSDSNLCVKTVNEWASAWEKRGWKRSTGPIANLELVQELWRLSQAHPKVKLKWIKAHNGWLWNEYADSLASAWTRNTT